MVKKKRSKSSLQKDIGNVGKEIEKEVEEIEQWIVERKKFLIKLAWVAGGIIVLLILSRLYLRTGGFG